MNTIQKIVIAVGLVIIFGFIFVATRRVTAPALSVAPLQEEHSQTDYVTMDLSYPSSSETQYPDMYHFIQQSKSDFIRDFGSVSAEEAVALHLSKDRQYAYTMATRIATSTNTVSYIIEVYQFTGGAHGGTTVNTFTYDTKGALVTLDRLFTQSYLERLSQLSREYLYASLGEYSREESINSGTEPKIENFSSWYVTPKTIVFIFGQYSVGPYAIGIQEFPLDKSKIADILSPEFR